MQRRTKVRIVSFSLALLTALTAWGIVGTVSTVRLKREKNAVQQHALTVVTEYLDKIETTLLKASYAATGKKLSALAADLRTLGAGAKAGLSSLSAGEATLTNTYKFLSQVGEYTAALGKKADAGERFSTEETENLGALLQKAGLLRRQFAYMTGLLDAGLFSFEQIKAGLRLLDEENADVSFYADASAEAEQSMADFPTLIYDGPFSDQIFSKTSALLAGAEEVSRAAAAKTAATALETDEKTLIFEGEAEGRIPVYAFSASGRRIAVTKAGGYVAYILSDASPAVEKLTNKDAERLGESYLKKLGYTHMRPTYEAAADGVCVVNFAAVLGRYTVYPDLIKVGVSLSDGKVVSLDARDYIMNHTPRSVPTAAVSVEAARAAVSERLTVKATDYALIPTPGGEEKYAYEFLCTDENERDVLVYVNVLTGDEEDILLLLYADGGTLVK